MKKDEKYHIEQLQNLVCYLAEIYGANKWEFCDKNKINMGPLAMKEWDEISRFKRIQPIGGEGMVNDMARMEIPRKIDWNFLYKRIESRAFTRKQPLFNEDNGL